MYVQKKKKKKKKKKKMKKKKKKKNRKNYQIGDACLPAYEVYVFFICIYAYLVYDAFRDYNSA